MNKYKTVLITGCSSGFGFLTAVEFAKYGYKVFATMRNVTSLGGQKLLEISKKENLDIVIKKLDVTNTQGVNDLVEEILITNEIDVLINNAGYAYITPIENLNPVKFYDEINSNVLGAVNLIKKILPSMKKNRSGRIINISSILGLINIAGYGPYSASKHALESMSLTLDLEINKYGIRSILVNPGAFPTNFEDNKIKNESPPPNKDFDFDRLQNSSSTKVAKLILKVAETKYPKVQYLIGGDAVIGGMLYKYLPTTLFYNLLGFYLNNFKRA